MTVDRPRDFSSHPPVCFFTETFLGRLQDVEIVEDGAKHTLVLYNCKMPQTGEVAFTAANAKSSANLKVKGERPRPHCASPARWFYFLGKEKPQRSGSFGRPQRCETDRVCLNQQSCPSPSSRR